MKLAQAMNKSQYLKTKINRHPIVKQFINQIVEIDKESHFEYELNGIRYPNIDELILNLEMNGESKFEW